MKAWTSCILISFGLGALAGLLAAYYNSQYIGTLAPVFFRSPSLFIVLAVSLVAPFVEEQVKLLGLFLFKATKKRLKVDQWAILGTFAGLGFGLFENIFYTFQVLLEYGTAAAMLVLLMRSLLSLPTHMITCSIAGFGFGLWATKFRFHSFLKYLLMAIAIHGLFNFTVLSLEGGLR
jgi:RsiW-degrading membrane proteinase PrsW (M82 family)